MEIRRKSTRLNRGGTTTADEVDELRMLNSTSADHLQKRTCHRRITLQWRMCHCFIPEGKFSATSTSMFVIVEKPLPHMSQFALEFCVWHNCYNSGYYSATLLLFKTFRLRRLAVDWSQLSRCHLKTGTDFSLQPPKRHVLNRKHVDG